MSILIFGFRKPGGEVLEIDLFLVFILHGAVTGFVDTHDAYPGETEIL